MTDIVDVIFGYSDRIKNSRTPESIMSHGEGEVVELREELEKFKAGEAAGEDGIVGEVADVLACMIDLLRVTNPNLTADDFRQVVINKCDKWVAKYGDK